MIALGIDLAGKEKNPTGICILNDRYATTKIVHTDKEIVDIVTEVKPDLVAIDAPFLLKPKIRKCDRELKKYGAFPPTMKSMHALSRRGYLLAEHLRKLGFGVIEVFPTASAKILGIYSKDLASAKRNLLELGLILKNKIATRHELDAVESAYTGALWLRNMTRDIGDKREGIIVVPETKKLLSQ